MTQIWTCAILASFLDGDPGWEKVAALPRAAAFVKRRDGVETAEWVDQPFVYRRSPTARRALGSA